MRLQTGWTGGQYSLCRGLLGLLVAAQLTGLFAGATWGLRVLIAAGVAGALLLGAGWRDREAAVLDLVVLGIVLASPALASAARVPLDARSLAGPWLLLLHLFVPTAPYGSLAARGRIDPRGGFRMPAFIPWAHRAAFLLVALRLFARGAGPLDLGWLTLLALLAFDPGWIRPAGRKAKTKGAERHPETLFYDGTCGLCHGAVRFLLAEDRFAHFRFAPLQGRAFRSAIPKAERETLPDSLVLMSRRGATLTKARAVRHALEAIGGYWRALAVVARFVPVRVADAAYDAVARIRHRLFRRPAEACPLSPPELRTRFLAD